ncbi:hypothetical protein pipiens_012279 [Culex pipiens pipiens]|uniref:Uncharacterized protein n=1 Tax=Culex pipiens pipiens TaxID=38569 RepID=A0ABD1D2Z9_CULPP
MNGNRTNSVASRTWRRSLNSAIKASLVLLVHDKNVYNCATKIRPATDRPRQETGEIALNSFDQMDKSSLGQAPNKFTTSPKSRTTPVTD